MSLRGAVKEQLLESMHAWMHACWSVQRACYVCLYPSWFPGQAQRESCKQGFKRCLLRDSSRGRKQHIM
jgi:hypothetical protein